MHFPHFRAAITWCVAAILILSAVSLTFIIWQQSQAPSPHPAFSGPGLHFSFSPVDAGRPGSGR